MAYTFETQEAATFKVPAVAGMTINKALNVEGVNATLNDANVICEGVASLLSMASLSGVFVDAVRTVNEDVNEDE